MKNRFRFKIVLLTFALLVSQGAMTAYAETEGSTEGSVVVTESGNVSSDTLLSSLKIAQAVLNPEFSPNQLTYTATVPYEVDRVALTAQTNSPTAKKVIRGTSDLEVGENTITVTVTAEDGSVREYRITLIRQEMSETTPSESDESQETTPEGTDSEETTPAETTPGETSPAETTPAETTLVEPTSEEVMTDPASAPQQTQSNGGMMMETETEGRKDLNSLLLNPMFLIVLVGAILLVSLIVIIVAVIVLHEKLSHRKDEDDQIEDESEEEDGDPHDWEDVIEDVTEESTAEEWDEDFEEVTLEEKDISVVSSKEDAAEMTVEEDLDDDFEVLLEDDDDFDFLEF